MFFSFEGVAVYYVQYTKKRDITIWHCVTVYYFNINHNPRKQIHSLHRYTNWLMFFPSNNNFTIENNHFKFNIY